MKSYKEVAENVLKRRDKYLAEKKRKRTIVYRSVAVGFSFCMVVLVGVGIWNNQKIKDTTDVNYIFINEISKLVDRIIVKLKELQMKRW